MRFLIQRVQHASVTIDGACKGKIEKGFLVLIGICAGDNREIADKLVQKMIGLRIFEDSEGKTNLNLQSVDGNLLLVSQFTLYADCKKGNRPSFTTAATPDIAEPLYEYIVSKARESFPNLQTGSFGADMKVELLNDGPFTVILDSAEIC